MLAAHDDSDAGASGGKEGLPRRVTGTVSTLDTFLLLARRPTAEVLLMNEDVSEAVCSVVEDGATDDGFLFVDMVAVGQHFDGLLLAVNGLLLSCLWTFSNALFRLSCILFLFITKTRAN